MSEHTERWSAELQKIRDRRDHARERHEEAVRRSEAALAASRAALKSIAHVRPVR